MKKLFLLLTFFAISIVAHAQSAFPNKPITLVVPYPVGGSNDVFARLIAKNLGEALKVSVVVDNRPGASGTTGTTQVSKSAPDGYTFYYGTTAAIVTNVYTFKNLPYDPEKGFAHITQTGSLPYIVVTHPSLPAKTVRELIALTRSRGDGLHYGGAGPGARRCAAAACGRRR